VAGRSNARARRPGQEGEKFPPLTTTLEALLQDGSDGPLRNLIYELINLSALMIRNREHFASYIGVTDPQFMMMSIVAEDSAATVGRIATRLGVSSQFVTTEIGKLETAGIVERRANDADRRSMLLLLTTKGRVLLCELAPMRRRINDITFRSLTTERAARLHDILADLIRDASTANHDLQSPSLHGRKAPSAQEHASEGTKRDARQTPRAKSK
jgi:MarR family transcriptional regulator, organic hydroperoxide resistance regulator